MLVREALENDRAAVDSVTRLAFAQLRSIYRPQDCAAAIATEGPRLVAEIDGRVVGTVAYAIEADRLHLRGLAVDPTQRRLGIARALVDQLRQLGQAASLRALSLYTVKQTGNVAIFERLGFHPLREEPAAWAVSPRSEALTDVYMERPLSEPPSPRARGCV